jgi:hypothetical protein
MTSGKFKIYQVQMGVICRPAGLVTTSVLVWSSLHNFLKLSATQK